MKEKKCKTHANIFFSTGRGKLGGESFHSLCKEKTKGGGEQKGKKRERATVEILNLKERRKKGGGGKKGKKLKTTHKYP